MALGGDDRSRSAALRSFRTFAVGDGGLRQRPRVSLCCVCWSWGHANGGAVCGLSFGLATPIWALRDALHRSRLSAACLVFAFSAAMRIGRTGESADRRLGAIVGPAPGGRRFEFPAAVPAVLWPPPSFMRGRSDALARCACSELSQAAHSPAPRS